ncbi:MAG: TerC family protein [Gammaproteobacteria bacterium]|nr:TerC family protein [Gammaproteobacteria bacterium]
MELLLQPEVWIAFATLTLLEIVLGIDNIIFVAILVNKLPVERRKVARIAGLGLAMGLRVGLLLALTWLMAINEPLFFVLGEDFNLRDLVLIFGGLFLLTKSTLEIHEELEGTKTDANPKFKPVKSFFWIMVQIAVIDLVFSLDSIITAIALANDIEVMVAAVIIAVLVMMAASGPISHFIDRHPTVRMLALSFLLLIGMMLMVEGFGIHVPKGYIYFAMAFSMLVEALNSRIHARNNRQKE